MLKYILCSKTAEFFIALDVYVNMLLICKYIVLMGHKPSGININKIYKSKLSIYYKMQSYFIIVKYLHTFVCERCYTHNVIRASFGPKFLCCYMYQVSNVYMFQTEQVKCLCCT
jgi:hypothetical protein